VPGHVRSCLKPCHLNISKPLFRKRCDLQGMRYLLAADVHGPAWAPVLGCGVKQCLLPTTLFPDAQGCWTA
jgi:hypothetical protein